MYTVRTMDDSGRSEGAIHVKFDVIDQNMDTIHAHHRPLHDRSEDSDDDSDEDRKPAAVNLDIVGAPNASRDDDGNDEGASSESSSSMTDQSDDETSKAAVVTEEGRRLSRYEVQRLERIKRNRQYLEQLGLEGETAIASMDKPKRRSRRKKAEILSTETIVPRETISRRSKMKKVSYAEPRTSVRDLFRQADRQREPESGGDDPNAATTREKSDKDETEIPSQQEHSNSNNDLRKMKSLTDRMDQTIFIEFKRIKAQKRLVVKTATRHFRAAQKEVKFWNKLLPAWERHSAQQEERSQLGGKSAKELLAVMDKRMPAIARAIKRYDDSIIVRAVTDKFVALSGILPQNSQVVLSFLISGKRTRGMARAKALGK
jgi:hypothetical protein